jgi:hypothetical protein
VGEFDPDIRKLPPGLPLIIAPKRGPLSAFGIGIPPAMDTCFDEEYEEELVPDKAESRESVEQ